MRKIRRAFTIWYIKRGYTFGYDFTGVPVYDDGFMRTPMGIPRAAWTCPMWVRPLLIFFSPSVYGMETYGKAITEGFERGLRSAVKKGD